MMSATAAVTTVECLNTKMPFSLLHFSRPLLCCLQFSYQLLTFISCPPTPAPLKHLSFIQENVVKVTCGFKKLFVGWCTTCSFCFWMWESKEKKKTQKVQGVKFRFLTLERQISLSQSQHLSPPDERIRQRVLTAIQRHSPFKKPK